MQVEAQGGDLFLAAVGDVAKARGMMQIARDNDAALSVTLPTIRYVGRVPSASPATRNTNGMT